MSNRTFAIAFAITLAVVAVMGQLERRCHLRDQAASRPVHNPEAGH